MGESPFLLRPMHVLVLRSERLEWGPRVYVPIISWVPWSYDNEVKPHKSVDEETISSSRQFGLARPDFKSLCTSERPSAPRQHEIFRYVKSLSRLKTFSYLDTPGTRTRSGIRDASWLIEARPRMGLEDVAIRSVSSSTAFTMRFSSPNCCEWLQLSLPFYLPACSGLTHTGDVRRPIAYLKLLEAGIFFLEYIHPRGELKVP